MDNRIIHQVKECKVYPGEWIVEGINYHAEGEVYMSRFSGPLSEERAKDYAAWQNGRIMSNASSNPTPKLTADTADVRARHIMTWPCIDERTRKMHRLAIVAEIDSAEAAATRKAFEKAAEAAEKNCGYVSRLCDPDKENICRACQAAEDIRALAKEQADG